MQDYYQPVQLLYRSIATYASLLSTYAQNSCILTKTSLFTEKSPIVAIAERSANLF